MAELQNVFATVNRLPTVGVPTSGIFDLPNMPIAGLRTTNTTFEPTYNNY